jgi:hypothetical protein
MANSLPPAATMRRNLLRVYRKATASERIIGAEWYPSARRIVREWAHTYSYHDATVASVIAALSPQCQWERNLIIAHDILALRASWSPGAIRENVRKAIILRDQTDPHELADTAENRVGRVFPSGPKVTCFAGNLAGNDTLVTVDIHAGQAAIGNPAITPRLRWKHYSLIACAYTDAAAHSEMLPSAFQAIIWVVWKRLYPAAVKRSIQRRYVS